MTRHYLIAIGFVVITGCAALGIPSLSTPAPEVTRDSFDRIKVGMTKAEVETILGSQGFVTSRYEIPFQKSVIECVTYRNTDDPTPRIVEFRDGIVAAKQWSDEPQLTF